MEDNSNSTSFSMEQSYQVKLAKIQGQKLQELEKYVSQYTKYSNKPEEKPQHTSKPVSQTTLATESQKYESSRNDNQSPHRGEKMFGQRTSQSPMQKREQLGQTRAEDSTIGYCYPKSQPYTALPSNNHLSLDSIESFSLQNDQSSLEIQQLISEIKETSEQLKKPLLNLNQQISPQNLSKANKSTTQLKSKKEFQYDQKTGLYSIDLASIKGQAVTIGPAYLNKIKNVNMYLMNKIQIGSKIKHDKLKLLFAVYFESLQYLQLERNWKEDKSDEHGFDFIENPRNLEKIKHLLWKGNYLSERFVQQGCFDLPALQVLELNFEKEVDDKQLYQLFQKIGIYNYEFKVHIWTQKSLQQFKGQVEQYHDRIVVKHRDPKPILNEKLLQDKQKEMELQQKKEQKQVKKAERKKQQAEEQETASKSNYIHDIQFTNSGSVNGDMVIGQKGNIVYNNNNRKR